MLVADAEMNGGAVGQFLAGPGEHLLEKRLRLVELVLLHGAQSSFVVLQSLRVARIFRDAAFLGLAF